MSDRVASVPAEIRSQHYQNTSLEHYRYAIRSVFHSVVTGVSEELAASVFRHISIHPQRATFSQHRAFI
jgi:hypothetical protein